MAVALLVQAFYIFCSLSTFLSSFILYCFYLFTFHLIIEHVLSFKFHIRALYSDRNEWTLSSLKKSFICIKVLLLFLCDLSVALCSCKRISNKKMFQSYKGYVSYG